MNANDLNNNLNSIRTVSTQVQTQVINLKAFKYIFIIY